MVTTTKSQDPLSQDFAETTVCLNLITCQAIWGKIKRKKLINAVFFKKKSTKQSLQRNLHKGMSIKKLHRNIRNLKRTPKPCQKREFQNPCLELRGRCDCHSVFLLLSGDTPVSTCGPVLVPALFRTREIRFGANNVII